MGSRALDVFSQIVLASSNGLVLWKMKLNLEDPQSTYSEFLDYAEERSNGIYRVQDSGIIAVTRVIDPALATTFLLDKQVIEGLLLRLCKAYTQSEKERAPMVIDALWITNSIALEKRYRTQPPQNENVVMTKNLPASHKSDSLLVALYTLVRRWIFGQPANQCYSSEEQMLRQVEENLERVNVAGEVVRSIKAKVKRHFQHNSSVPMTRSNLKLAFSTAIHEILRPAMAARGRDILSELSRSISSGNVYVVAIMGTNGVGKSTSLAKIANYLSSQGGAKRIVVAACDTFRAGAVEQLDQHCKALGLTLFQKGYNIDPTSVAMAALAHARQIHAEVLLIDTAGRMQNNQPLMDVLGNLVATVKPNLNVFVGEALVGNDALDQIQKFDEIVRAASKNEMTIDGIVLSKFDTVDDKIGTTLSLAYQSQKPILFVGTGQKYCDLNRLEVSVSHVIIVSGERCC